MHFSWRQIFTLDSVVVNQVRVCPICVKFDWPKPFAALGLTTNSVINAANVSYFDQPFN